MTSLLSMVLGFTALMLAVSTYGKEGFYLLPPIAIVTLIVAVCVALAGVVLTGYTIRRTEMKLFYVLAFFTSCLLSSVTLFFAASYLW